jgi:hypothetical protein
MNWYKRIIKFAQIWETGSDESFEGELKAIYELEYKLQALKNFDFTGLEERKYNMIEKLEDSLEMAIQEVKDPLLYTFEKWLESHALLDPQLWAEKRFVGDYDYGYGSSNAGLQELESVISEYERYKNKNKGGLFRGTSNEYERGFSEILNIAMANKENFPTLIAIEEIYSSDYRTMLEEELQSEGEEQFGINRTGEPFNDAQALDYIQGEIENFDMSDYIYNYGIEGFIHSMGNNSIDLDQFLIELNKNIVFPLWFSFWEERGIEETRENVENAYKMLEEEGDINYQIVAINHALNTTHQTGEMIDYLEQNNPDISGTNIKGLLDELSSNKFLPQWNKQLKEVGVKIPRNVSQLSQLANV